MPQTLQFWTDFADGAVMFPLGIAIALALLILRQHRAALVWSLAIGCVWGTMLVFKLAGYMIEGLLPASPLSMIDLVTPSGHVASATVVYGGLIGLLLWRPDTLVVRTLLATAVIAAGMSVTRVMMGAHSISEVLTGAAVGIVGVYCLTAAGVQVERRARLPLVIVAALVMVTQYGTHLGWEQTIHHIAVEAIEHWHGMA
ncbi:MAG: phosphatase PAP2 family protein [Janthinobacterium lividum]